MSARIRTSLMRAISGTTPAEQALRMQELERQLWLRFGAIVVRQTDPGMAIVVEAIGVGRFGKRETHVQT